MANSDYAGDIPPQQAWAMLEQDARAQLVDVRTPAEWTYVGVPDLSSMGKEVKLIPWMLFPGMEFNPEFGEQLAKVTADHEAPLLFLCRSGVRSRAAAVAATRLGYRHCYNIGSGFEGVHDASRHRGTVNGWKVDGLPWMQG